MSTFPQNKIIAQLEKELRKDPKWADIRIMPLSYKVRKYSKSIHATMYSKEGISQDIFIKTYEHGGFEKSSTELKRLIEAEFKILKFLHAEGLSVVKPLFYIPEYLTIVTEKRHGHRFQDLLIRKARLYPSVKTINYLEQLCYGCGRWLRDFQQITQTKERFNLDILREGISWRINRLDNLFDQRLREKILTYFEEQKEGIDEAYLKVSGVHGDFFPGNILINGEEIVVLDFTMFRYGSVYTDLAYFSHQLETLLLKPFFRKTIITVLKRAFLMGYDEGLILEKNPLFRLFRIQHLLSRLVALSQDKDYLFYQRLYNLRIAKRCIKLLEELCNLDSKQ
jgi:tRNA A-37 threonylcarbamoyl transferase component Bud32